MHEFTDTTNLCTSCTLVGTLILLIALTFNKKVSPRGYLPQKPRYSISIEPKNDFSPFTFNPASASFWNYFPNYFLSSVTYVLVTTSMLSIHTCTLSNPSYSSDIFSWNISGLLHMTRGSFWYSYFPQGSTILQRYFDPGDNYIWWYPMFRSSDDACVNHYSFSSMSCILEIGKDFLYICWFNLLKPDKIVLFRYVLVRQ